MNEKENVPNLTKSDTAGEESLQKIVMQDFDDARGYIKKKYLDTWRDCWKAYNNIRSKQSYYGTSNDFVPETFTIVESVKANIAGGKPKFDFVPVMEEQEQDTDILNALVDFYWSQNNMTQKTQNWVHDMLVYGNGIMMTSWEGDKVVYTNVPLTDFFVDPTATHLDHPDKPGYAKYAGRRYLISRNSLKNAKIVNPDTGEMEELYKNLDKIDAIDSQDDKLDKEQKEMNLGSQLERSDDEVEIIEYYTRKKKILIANRRTIIYNGDNPYKRDASTRTVEVEVDGRVQSSEVEVPAIKGFLPFSILRNYVDASLFYAKGDVENIIDRQEALNDVSSQKHDSLIYALTNMWQIDPQYQHLAEQIESIPGAVFPIPLGAMQPIEKQLVGQEADIEMRRIQEEMRRATAADEVVQGVSQQKGRVTATEVQAQMNQASQRFATKLTTLEDEGFAQLARITFWMIQIFVDTPMAVRIVGPDGVAWKDFDPTEYTGEYEPKVQLESTTKAVQAEEGQKFALVHQMYAQSPLVDQREMARLYFESMLDVSDAKLKKLLPEQPPMAQMMPMAPAPGIQNPGGVPSGPLPTAM